MPIPPKKRARTIRKQQLLMLERLTVAERIELRRLIAKAQGTPTCRGGESTSIVGDTRRFAPRQRNHDGQALGEASDGTDERTLAELVHGNGDQNAE